MCEWLSHDLRGQQMLVITPTPHSLSCFSAHEEPVRVNLYNSLQRLMGGVMSFTCSPSHPCESTFHLLQPPLQAQPLVYLCADEV